MIMKEKLLNLLLEVHRFSSLTISDSFLYDAAYMEILAEVLFVHLRSSMKKQVWVRRPHLQVHLRDVQAVLSTS